MSPPPLASHLMPHKSCSTILQMIRQTPVASRAITSPLFTTLLSLLSLSEHFEMQEGGSPPIPSKSGRSSFLLEPCCCRLGARRVSPPSGTHTVQWCLISA